MRIDVAAGVPIAADELRAALRVRLAEGPALVVHVRPVRDGVVVVGIGEHAREVAIGALAGAEAARLIALSVADLALDDLATAPPPEAVAATPTVPARAAVPALPAATQLSFAALGTVAAWPGALVGGGAEIAVSRGTWLGFAGVEGGALASGALTLRGAPVRVGGGWRTGSVELRAGATAMPLWVATGPGDQTVLVGGGVSARLRLPVAPGVRVVLVAGVDAYATRSEYRVTAASTIETPWVAPYAAAGVEVAP